MEISRARRRRRLAEGIVVTYTVGVATANEAQTVTSAISSSSTADVDAAISKAARRTRASTKISTASRRQVWVRPPPRRPATTGPPTATGGDGGADAASTRNHRGRGGGRRRPCRDWSWGVRVHAFQEQRGFDPAGRSAVGRIRRPISPRPLPKAVASAPPRCRRRHRLAETSAAPAAPLLHGGPFCAQCGARA